jgi:DNA-binding MarR family transcriptional regulator
MPMAQEPRKEELVESILQLTDKAFKQFLPMVPNEWLRLNVTMSQLKVMFLLLMGGTSRMSEISSALSVSLATATGVVDRLVERGFVVREGQPEDRRVVLCRLSEKGEQLLNGLWQLSRERAGALMRALTPSQLLLITEVLEALIQAWEVTIGETEGARI